MTRRAAPSSSSKTAAAVNWLATAIRTERPPNSSRRPASTVPASKLLQEKAAFSPHKRRVSPTAPRAPLSDGGSFRGMFIKVDKVAESYRELGILRGAERVKPEQGLKSSHDNRKAQRVEPRI